MTGDERKRHCELCKLNVYNIKELSTDEAYDLLANASARVCVRLYKRHDGTVLTDDCPVGLRRMRNFYRKCAVATIGLLAQMGLSSVQPAYAQWIGAKSSDETPVAETKEKTTDKNKKERWEKAKKEFLKFPEMGQHGPDVEVPMGQAAEPTGHITGTVPPPQAETGKLKVTEEVKPNSGPNTIDQENYYQGGVSADIYPKKPKKVEPARESNKLLAGGLSLTVLAAAFAFVFGKLKKRSSIWIVGCTFGLAFVAIGLIWQCYW